MTDLKNFFPDARLHQADLYEISYEYALAHNRIETMHDRGRDSLTGLINDQGFLSEIFEVELKLLALLEDSRAMAVFRIDLDGFKAVNDAYGHEAGDQVLRDFSAQLRKQFQRSFDIMSVSPDRDSDSIEGRPGGDEFLLMVNDINMAAPTDITADDYAHYPQDFLETHSGIGNKVLFTYARRIMAAATAVILPDGSRLSASTGFVRIHQEEASRMLYGKPDKGAYDRRNFQHYNIRADHAAKLSKEWGDGVASEYSPTARPVPMTIERLRAKGSKRFKRDYPDLRIDPDVDRMLNALAELLAEKYKAIGRDK
jgi:diguanylate cyclase (GGDEF)-like protein